MRSPAYPVFSLKEGVAKTKRLWDAQKKHEAHIDSAIEVMGYSKKTGPSMRAISALIQYGLIVETGSKSDRRLKISDLAQDIILLPESDDRNGQARRKAALKPTIHAHLWEKYRPMLPADSTISPYLIRDKHFNDKVVEQVITGFRESVEFAKLDKLDESDAVDDNREAEETANEMTSSPEVAQRPTAPAMSVQPPSISQDELPVMVGEGRIAKIPFPMTSEDFDLLIGTLNLYKKRIVSDSDQK